VEKSKKTKLGIILGSNLKYYVAKCSNPHYQGVLLVIQGI
jgi:hypothetical protein